MQSQAVDIPFDAIFTLLIFLIGIPALIFQFMTPEIRRIVFAPQRRWWLVLDVILPLLTALLVSCAGIWMEFRLNDLSPYHHSLRWVFIFAALIFITLVIGFHIPLRYGRRESIVATLRREAQIAIQKNGRIAENTLEDLIDVGKNATLAQERKLVLEALRALAERIYTHPAYDGDGLDRLIMGVVEIISQGDNALSPEIFEIAAAILQDIALNKKDGHLSADLRRAIKAAGEMGRVALVTFSGLEADNIGMKFVEALGLVLLNPQHLPLASDVTESLFDMGSLAFEKGKPLIGMATISKMMALLSTENESSPEQRNEQIADFLGLLAHCWAKEGAHREIARARLCEVESYLSDPLPQTLRAAYAYYIDRTRFETATKLARMAADLGYPLNKEPA